MAIVKCTACGNQIQVPQHSSGMPWVIGCLVVAVVIPMVVAVLGLLAAIAIPSFVKARQTSQENVCINNMRQIDSAKEQWAMQANANAGAVAGAAEISPYLMGGVIPACPAAGTYTLHVIAQEPECSTHGSLSAAVPGVTRR